MLKNSNLIGIVLAIAMAVPVSSLAQAGAATGTVLVNYAQCTERPSGKGCPADYGQHKNPQATAVKAGKLHGVLTKGPARAQQG